MIKIESGKAFRNGWRTNGWSESVRRFILAAVAMAGAAAIGPATALESATLSPVAAPCRAEVPADLTLAPTRWMGECRNGAADGLGVLRAGTAGPYEFFAGRMRDGHLVDGVLLLKSGLMMVAVRFDASRRVVVSDGLRPGEDEAVFKTATDAAGAVSRRFAAAGNRSSAAYYARLAQKIRNAPPE